MAGLLGAIGSIPAASTNNKGPHLGALFVAGSSGGFRVTLCDGSWHFHANRALKGCCYGGFIGRDWFDPRCNRAF